MATAALIGAPVAAFADDTAGQQPGDVPSGVVSTTDEPAEDAAAQPSGGADDESAAEPAADSGTPESAALADADGPIGVQDAATTSTINLLAITDFHGHFKPTPSDPGAPALSCEFTKASSGYDTTFRLSVGDNIGGSAYESAIQKDNPTIAILNAMGIQVSAVGNHEFDNGAQQLADRINGAPMGADAPADDPSATWETPDFPYLWANIGGMPATDQGGAYEILTDPVSGARVAFIGGVTDELSSLVSPSAIAGLAIADPVTTINTLAEQLKDSDQADLVVGLLHKDMENTHAQVSTAVDAVFGGHSHVTYATGSPVPSIQAGSFGQDLGQIVLTVAHDGDTYSVASATETIYDTATIAGCTDQVDPTVQSLTDDAVAKATVLGDVPAVEVGGSFYRGLAVLKAGTPAAEARGVESTMGDLVANAVRDASDLYMPSGKADIGVTNAGGLRADLVPDANGMLTKGQLFTSQPFGNQMAYAEMTGAQFIQALEDQWQPNTPSGEPPSRAMLKLAVSDNVSYGFDSSAERGHHILWVNVNGAPIDPAATYTVAGNNFLLTGGDHFDAFKGANAVNTGFIDLDLLTQYLERRAAAGDPATPFELSDNAIAIDNLADWPDTFAAGHSYTVDLSSLSFTDKDEQKNIDMRASSVSVCLLTDGGSTVLGSGTIDNSDLIDGTAMASEDRFGAASVTFTVPEDVADGDQLAICHLEAAFVSSPVVFAEVQGQAVTPTPEPSESGSATPTPSASPVKPGLAASGADGGLLVGGLAVLVVGAALTLLRRVGQRD